MRVLVTGATGYIGGRLVPRLLERGHRVRVLVRDPRRVLGRPWADGVEVVTGDLTVEGSLGAALEDVDAAYYLVHAMCTGRDWEARDRRAAHAFVGAARGIRRVVYLGGLQPTPGPPSVSAHLRSRGEVGRILREGLPTLEFRAGPVIGSGSGSFEMVRYLTERLPVIVGPSWILNRVQPIGVRPLLEYLVAALEHPAIGVVDLGEGPLSFRDMLLQYAEVRGLKRIILTVPPILPPTFAAPIVGMVTPIPNCLAVPLVEGIVRPVLADSQRAKALFPHVTPMSYADAVSLALQRVREGQVPTRWSGALAGGSTYTFEDREGVAVEVRSRWVRTSQEAVYRAFASLGGTRGWRVWRWAWWIRGVIDQVLGGPGLRRGRRHPVDLQPGEAVDFWRVEEARPPEILRLRAEMKVPGKAWLQWEALPEGEGTRLIQRAFFSPTGFWGAAYWYGLYPLHRRIFSALVNALARDAAEGRPGPGGPSGRPPASEASSTGRRS
jgi:uncharacterized protein YbjT (DUF2867 family)